MAGYHSAIMFVKCSQKVNFIIRSYFINRALRGVIIILFEDIFIERLNFYLYFSSDYHRLN